jgi:hypothetical protein
MKKLLAVLFFTGSCILATAQTDSTLNEYTGKFVFGDGSPVPEITLLVENGVLNGTSAIGNSEFKKTDTKDVFDIVAYSGIATFKRNAEGKVVGVRIQVQDVNMEGTKAETGKFAGSAPWELKNTIRSGASQVSV